MGQMTVWTTQTVQQTIEKLRFGVQTDMSCFHEKDIELKASNILFKLSSEEIEEFHKCSTDINYFVSRYCRFLTDQGRRTVTLRDFQEEILEELGEEVEHEWMKDEDGDPMLIPKNRNYILMAARQTGKCLFDSSIEIQDKNLNEFTTPINLLYYIHKEHLTFLEKLKFKVMRLYDKVNNW